MILNHRDRASLENSVWFNSDARQEEPRAWGERRKLAITVTMQTLSVKSRVKDGALSVKTVRRRDGDGAGAGAKPFEVYGFVGSIGSVVSFIVYLIWAYAPESWLLGVGITYYPSKYWAVALPSYLMVVVLFICTLYMSLNYLSTPPPQSLHTIFDDHSRPGAGFSLDEHPQAAIPAHSDMPITEVNALMWG